MDQINIEYNFIQNNSNNACDGVENESEVGDEITEPTLYFFESGSVLNEDCNDDGDSPPVNDEESTTSPDDQNIGQNNQIPVVDELEDLNNELSELHISNPHEHESHEEEDVVADQHGVSIERHNVCPNNTNILENDLEIVPDAQFDLGTREDNENIPNQHEHQSHEEDVVSVQDDISINRHNVLPDETNMPGNDSEIVPDAQFEQNMGKDNDNPASCQLPTCSILESDMPHSRYNEEGSGASYDVGELSAPDWNHDNLSARGASSLELDANAHINIGENIYYSNGTTDYVQERRNATHNPESVPCPAYYNGHNPWPPPRVLSPGYYSNPYPQLQRPYIPTQYYPLPASSYPVYPQNPLGSSQLYRPPRLPYVRPYFYWPWPYILYTYPPEMTYPEQQENVQYPMPDVIPSSSNVSAANVPVELESAENIGHNEYLNRQFYSAAGRVNGPVPPEPSLQLGPSLSNPAPPEPEHPCTCPDCGASLEQSYLSSLPCCLVPNHRNSGIAPCSSDLPYWNPGSPTESELYYEHYMASDDSGLDQPEYVDHLTPNVIQSDGIPDDTAASGDLASNEPVICANETTGSPDGASGAAHNLRYDPEPAYLPLNMQNEVNMYDHENENNDLAYLYDGSNLAQNVVQSNPETNYYTWPSSSFHNGFGNSYEMPGTSNQYPVDQYHYDPRPSVSYQGVASIPSEAISHEYPPIPISSPSTPEQLPYCSHCGLAIEVNTCIDCGALLLGYWCDCQPENCLQCRLLARPTNTTNLTPCRERPYEFDDYDDDTGNCGGALTVGVTPRSSDLPSRPTSPLPCPSPPPVSAAVAANHSSLTVSLSTEYSIPKSSSCFYSAPNKSICGNLFTHTSLDPQNTDTTSQPGNLISGSLLPSDRVVCDSLFGSPDLKLDLLECYTNAVASFLSQSFLSLLCVLLKFFSNPICLTVESFATFLDPISSLTNLSDIEELKALIDAICKKYVIKIRFVFAPLLGKTCRNEARLYRY